MRRALGVLLVVAMLAAAAGWLFRASRGEVRPGEEEGVASADAAPGEARVRPLLSAARGGSTARRPRGAPAPLPSAFAPERRPAGPYVYGIVVDERGTPVPSAEVETTWMDENGNPGSVVADRTTSDETGRYLLPYPQERPFHRVTVRARGTGRISATHLAVPCGFVRLEVRPSVTVTGQVLDRETGRAIEGASVLEWVGDWAGYSGVRTGYPNWSSAQTSDATGRFTLVAPREGLRVSAWKEGYRYASTNLDPRDEGQADVEVRLEAAGKSTIRRRLVHQGRPVSGALVRLLDVSFGADREPIASVHTDGDGRFEVETVVGRDCALESRVGYLRAFDIVDGHGSKESDLDLLPPLVVTGRVTRGRRPFAGATVGIWRQAPREILTARTDDLGRYRFDDVRRPRDYMYVVVHLQDSGATWHAQTRVTHAQTEDAVLPTIELPSVRLSGHVRDEAGRPVPGAVVSLGEPRAAGGFLATTDREGAYSLGRPSWASSLHVSAPGYETAQVDVPADMAGTSDFVLRRGGP
jgi:hypothetical protein